MRYHFPCWDDMLHCEHLKDISDSNEEPEWQCELNDPDEDCPYKRELEEEDDDNNNNDNCW